MLRFISLTALCAVTASSAYAGGWETGKLDTSFLYESGNYAEFSYGNLDYSIEGTTQAGVTHKMAKDQTRVSVSGKFNLGRLEIGISSFDSGAIQMDGQSAASNRATCATAAQAVGGGNLAQVPNMTQNCSIVASADANLDTQAIIAKYKVNDNFSFIGGLRHVKLANSTVGTVRTDYSINSNSETGAIYGVAYTRPDIALRLELVHSAAQKMKLSGTASGLMAAAFGNNVPFADSSELNVPKAMTLKFQTGIAKDTLLMASVHRVDWKAAQIDVNFAGQAAALDVASDFSDTTAYSIGLGRKFTENTSGSISYSWEDGAGATSTSGFTMSNGSKTISLGLKHKLDNVTISGGVSYTEVGDVNVASSSGLLTSGYSNNSVTALGFKIGYNF